MTKPKQFVTVREINSHVFTGVGSCYVSGPGFRYRISFILSRRGVFEGRIISGSDKTWAVIPKDAAIEFYGRGWNGLLTRTLG